MKCQMCDSNFISIEWAKDETLFNLKYIICDKCLLYLLESRKDMEELNLRRSYTKINMLKDKIENDEKMSNKINPMDSVKSIPNGFSDWSEK